jgi:hypothetical protein
MIFFKKFQDFILEQPLNEMVSFAVLMLYKNKNIVAKLKNQNDGLIQDGNENFLYFSHNKPPF